MPSTIYETETLLNTYLLFHYGTAQDLLPFSFGPLDSFHFPVRCVTECLDVPSLPRQAKGLELGCAVGRSSFELSRFCASVLAIDNSHAFIEAARQIQNQGEIEYILYEEGLQRSVRKAKLPKSIDASRVEFQCRDVMDLFSEITVTYDVILAANLICRLENPLKFLESLYHLLSPEGQLILTSPYSWLEEFTPRNCWIGGQKKTLEYLKEIFKKHFDLKRCFDLPFLIREHYRKYQWGVAEVSIWKRFTF